MVPKALKRPLPNPFLQGRIDANEALDLTFQMPKKADPRRTFLNVMEFKLGQVTKKLGELKLLRHGVRSEPFVFKI